MSIAVLTQVYDETRRLAIAGSAVAPGDFRLKKLVPPLEVAGAKAPVFAKVAESVNAVIGSDGKTASEALLELASLVTAVLYTQGETGRAGTLEPIVTTDLGLTGTQTSARVLKPLLEALRTTGSGRLELIRDAVDRGQFRDLRLVKPALAALDEGYPEIADLIADKVLPLYGKAILPDLRAGFDPKGVKGHPRRLTLMHQLDPQGTRNLVKAALDAGSKEVKVAAIACLGDDPEDLSFLIEQSAAKAQDVRQAAYIALARSDDAAAVAVLTKAMAGKDLSNVAHALHESRNSKVLAIIIAEIDRDLAALPKVVDKKETSASINRMMTLLTSLEKRTDASVEKLLNKLFAQRGDLEKRKGDTTSGADLNHLVVRLMSEGPKSQQVLLANSHAELSSEDLSLAFIAARRSLPAAEVFTIFSPYLSKPAKSKGKTKSAVHSAIFGSTRGYHHYYDWRSSREEMPPLDERWLDIAIESNVLEHMYLTSRPGHAGLIAFLSSHFSEQLQKAKTLDDVRDVVALMVHSQHPDATTAFISAFEKLHVKSSHYSYWYTHLIAHMTKASIPQLEALLPTLGDNEADQWLDAIQALRKKL